MGVEDDFDVRGFRDVEAGHELGAVFDLLDRVAGDSYLGHQGSELVLAGEARQVEVLGVGHPQVAGDHTIPREQGVGQVD